MKSTSSASADTGGSAVDRFTWERAVLAHLPLTPGARALAFSLAVRMDARAGIVPARFSPSRARLMSEVGLSMTAGGRRAFYRYRSELVDAGFLHVVDGVGRGRPARYRAALPDAGRALVPAEDSADGAAVDSEPAPAGSEASPGGAAEDAPAGATPMSLAHTEGNNPPPLASHGVGSGAAVPARVDDGPDVEEILRNVTAEHTHLVDALGAPSFARDFVPAMHAMLDAMPVSEAAPIRDGLMLRTLDAWHLLALTIAEAHRCGLGPDLVSYTTAASGSGTPYAGVRDPARAWAKRVLTWDQMRRQRLTRGSSGHAGLKPVAAW